jgi:hypothetical protein
MSLDSIRIPSGITTIPGYAFDGCRNLRYAIMEGAISSIGAYVFNFCYNMELCDLRNCEAVPTLANKNSFNYTSADLKIVVPDALYDEWITATNWSDSSIVSKITKASEYNG